MQLDYELFVRARRRKRDSALCSKAFEGNNRYTKMVTQSRMSRKRMKKLLMASGMSRDEAEKQSIVHTPRMEYWQKNMVEVVGLIDSRQSPIEREVDDFGVYLNRYARKTIRKYYAEQDKKFTDEAFEKTNELLRGYPDISNYIDAKIKGMEARAQESGEAKMIGVLEDILSWYEIVQRAGG